MTHKIYIYYFNTVQELKLDHDAKCLQYPDQRHSNYLDSTLGNVKSLLTNIFFGIKQVTDIGDCGFVCLLIGINSDTIISNVF